MTPTPRSTLRSLALLASLTSACSATAQFQSGRGFPPRPAGTACEERLQRVRTVATPSVKREALFAALTPLHACRPELGRGIATSIVAVRATTDSALAITAFDGAFVYRDSAIARAAAEVARDRSASELVRALGFLSLYTTLTPHGYRPSLAELTAQPLTVERCAFGVATDAGDAVELTPIGAGLISSLGDVARSVHADPNESRLLRSAATCVLGVWRAASVR